MQRDNLSFYENSLNSGPVSIVSIPIELGSDERGLSEAPRYLLDHGLMKTIASIGREVTEKHAISCPQNSPAASAGSMKHVGEIAGVARGASKIVEAALRGGNTVVALGGDHSMAFGTLAGAALAHRSLGVIYIDAHPDCNTDETTITGNVHGMIATTLLGYGHEVLTGIPGRFLAPEDFLFIGLKDMDKAEIYFLRAHSMRSITMHDIEKRGISPAVSAIDALARRCDAIWVSMDMDSIDEAYSPGVGMPNNGGLTRREALALARHIGKVCPVVGLDIVEIVPAKDTGSKTARLALELIAHFLGGEFSWYQQEYIDTYREINIVNEQKKAKVRRRR